MTGVRRELRVAGTGSRTSVCRCIAARLAEVAGEDPQEPAAGTSRACCSGPAGRRGPRTRRRSRPRRSAATRRGAGPRRRRTSRRSAGRRARANASSTGSTPFTCSARNSRSMRSSWTSTPTIAARHHASVPGRTRRWKSASFGGLGQHRIDHDHRALGVLGDLLEHHARAREALRHPRVLADEQRHLGVLELAARVGAVQAVLDPELAGLLLRERARAVARADRPQERARCRLPPRWLPWPPPP